jgi:hypothetical protein
MARRWLPLLLVALAACGGDNAAPSAERGKGRLELGAPAIPAALSASVPVPVSGSVIDRDTQKPVADVEVVLRGDQGDITTKTAANGTFTLSVLRGAYRAFVRDARVISTGTQGRVRLRTLPSADLAGVADDKLMPLLDVDGPTSGVELSVTAGAYIIGIVSDPDGKPARDVVLQAVAIEIPFARSTTPNIGAPTARRGAPRPVLGTDITISDEDGQFILRVPPGRYEIVGTHSKYAGVGGIAELEVNAGDRMQTQLTLVHGCVITGKVTNANGSWPHDGAIETQSLMTGQFGATGRVNADGTFRWTTTQTEAISMRAWPWRQPPSAPQTFDCRDGKTFNNVVLAVPNAVPDIAGTIIDARGNPVPLAYLDVAPIDFGEQSQQERANAAGEWEVYEMRAGRYQITAAAAGRGIATETISAPRSDVVLRLSGTGRIAGTTTELVDGSFELTFNHCGPSASPIDIDEDARIVPVRGGRFSVERVPACALTFTARWRDKQLIHGVVVEPDATAYIELALGTPRAKEVRGVVRDDAGKAVANARVTAVIDNREASTVRSDQDGRFTLTTPAGSQLIAGDGRRSGRATVGRANVPTEQVDITLSSADDGL